MSKGLRIPKSNIEFNPPVYQCKRATKPFVLDGNIEKDFWADADFTEEFVDIEGDIRPTPRYRTKAKMLWDDENFYFGAILEGDEIWGTLEERDSVIFLDNDFEIFIDPDSDTHQYYEFEMNAKNTVWDLFLTKTYRDQGKPLDCFDIHGLQTAVHIDGELNNPAADNKRWMVEVVMPFASITECAKHKGTPNLGEFFRVNFSRVQWLVDVVDGNYEKRRNPETNQVCPEDNWVWAPTGVVNIHYPELWGFVFFTDGEDYKIPRIEYEKWELRRLYYNAHAFYDEHGYFTSNIDDIKGEWDYTIDAMVQGTKHGFEISCISEDETTELWIEADGRVYERNVQ